jgi:2-polyprenyl-3-methyl-5-hydroxy-6-metoxy-1,4-benzoquinol methylase
MTDTNPWLNIPLEDYERHMSHHLVGQSALLNSLTKKYLDETNPETVIFLGIAGGNGLEHIDNNFTKSVYGIDINPDYLDTAFIRYNQAIASLQLVNLDIVQNSGTICKADFIWAALVLEYTGIDKALEFCTNNIRKNGHLVVSIQSNNNKQSISPTGIESVKKAGEIFSIVSPEMLLSKASEAGYRLIGKEENVLPNEKSIITFHLTCNCYSILEI